MKTIEEMREYFIAEKHKYLNMNLEINCVYISRDLIVVINISLMNECAVSYEDMTFGGVKIIEVTGRNYFNIGVGCKNNNRTVTVVVPSTSGPSIQSMVNQYKESK